MIIIGTKITIIPSDELAELKLGGLIGEEGFVIEDLTDNGGATGDGYMVLFPASYRDEYVWYIPKLSAYEQD